MERKERSFKQELEGRAQQFVRELPKEVRDGAAILAGSIVTGTIVSTGARALNVLQEPAEVAGVTATVGMLIVGHALRGRGRK